MFIINSVADRTCGYRVIKSSWRTKVASAVLQEDIELSKVSGRKPLSQITWPYKLGGEIFGKTFKKVK